MSASQIITVSNYVAGVLTDYDSTPTLSDSGATYGVRLVSSGAVVVAAGTAMVRASVGTYSYNVIGLTAGLIYQYSYKRIYLGATNWTAKTFTAIDASTIASGYYCTQTDLEDEYGTTNIATWSQSDGTAGANPARIQRFLNWTDAAINQYFGGRFVVPLIMGANAKTLANRWAVVLCGARLYNNRGQRTEGQAENQYAVAVANVWKEMAEARNDTRFGFDATTLGAGVHPANVGVDPVSGRQSYGQGQTWTAFGWVVN